MAAHTSESHTPRPGTGGRPTSTDHQTRAGQNSHDTPDKITASPRRIGQQGPACLQTAAELHGFGVIKDSVTHVLVPPEKPCVRRLTLWPHQFVVGPGDIEELRCGTRTTHAARTAADLARILPQLDVLPALDAALRAGIDHPAITAELERQVGLGGIRQARELVGLADVGAESPQESRLRLRCYDAGLPTPTLQLPILDDRGRPCRWLDLGWEEEMVGLEYDGEQGHGADRRRAGRRRHNFLEGRDLAMFYATDLDVYRDHADLMRKVATTLARRSRASRR